MWSSLGLVSRRRSEVLAMLAMIASGYAETGADDADKD